MSFVQFPVSRRRISLKSAPTDASDITAYDLVKKNDHGIRGSRIELILLEYSGYKTKIVVGTMNTKNRPNHNLHMFASNTTI